MDPTITPTASAVNVHVDIAALAEQLQKTGVCVCPDFFPRFNELRADLIRRRSSGDFHKAGVGQGRELHDDSSIRRDEICWLEKGEGSKELWQALDDLREAFNRQLYLGLVDFEGHYAAYPPGGFYQRHRDSFRGDQNRAVSLVLYLNADWREADGGRLRVYQGDSFRDIDPIGGTLVCFLSRETEHEVLPSRSERLSFTGWFKVRVLGGAGL